VFVKLEGTEGETIIYTAEIRRVHIAFLSAIFWDKVTSLAELPAHAQSRHLFLEKHT
jgi:hypothetical protein